MEYSGGMPDYGWGSAAPPPNAPPPPPEHGVPPGPPMASLPDPSKMSVRELKAELMNLGVDFSDCYEKSELQAKLQSVQEKQRNVLQIDARTTAPATAAIIFLHGLGDQAHGWMGPLQTLAQRLPHVRILVPNAPVLKVTLNQGAPMPAWFDVKALEPAAEEDRETIGISQQFLDELIRDEIRKGVRIPPHRIVVGGFSQGGAVAVNCLIKHPQRLGGVFVLSGWVPLAHTVAADATAENKGTPIVFFHGDADSVVRHQWGADSVALLQQTHSNVSLRTYAGMGHQSNAAEMADLAEWILQTIP